MSLQLADQIQTLIRKYKKSREDLNLFKLSVNQD